MITQTYNTRISLIKAGKIISSKITISLILIWSALVIASLFLLFSNDGWQVFSSNQDALNHVQLTATDQSGKNSSEGAFVLVVRNKKMTLTRYTAYVGNNQNDGADNIKQVSASTTKAKRASIVIKKKNNNSNQANESDFSVKRVPYQ